MRSANSFLNVGLLVVNYCVHGTLLRVASLTHNSPSVEGKILVLKTVTRSAHNVIQWFYVPKKKCNGRRSGCCIISNTCYMCIMLRKKSKTLNKLCGKWIQTSHSQNMHKLICSEILHTKVKIREKFFQRSIFWKCHAYYTVFTVTRKSGILHVHWSMAQEYWSLILPSHQARVITASLLRPRTH